MGYGTTYIATERSRTVGRDPRERETSRSGSRGDDRGFALLVTLLALVGLTALATGGFLLTNADAKVSENFQSSRVAFHAAQSGLETFTATTPTPPPASATYDLGGDMSATVTATTLNAANQVYLVEATGSYTTPRGDVVQRRTGRVMLLENSTVPAPNSAMFAPTGMHKNGQAGTISGYDAAFTVGDDSQLSDCPSGGGQHVNGIEVQNGGYTQNGGNQPVPEGDPHDILERPQDQMVNDLDIPWADIVNGNALRAGHRVQDGGEWPDFDELSDDDYPVVFASDTSGLRVGPEKSGRGVLVVRGDLTMDGSFSWDGIVMVGGSITSNGNQTIEGAVFTGLNLKLGESVGQLSIGNGTKTFRYHSCNFHMAQQSLAKMENLPGTWYESF